MILFNHIIYLLQIQQVVKEKKYGITKKRREKKAKGKNMNFFFDKIARSKKFNVMFLCCLSHGNEEEEVIP